MKVLFENLQNQIIIDSTKNLEQFLKDRKINVKITDFCFPKYKIDVLQKEPKLFDYYISSKFPNKKFGLFCSNDLYLCFPTFEVDKDYEDCLLVRALILFYAIKKTRKDSEQKTLIKMREVVIYQNELENISQKSKLMKDFNSAYSYSLTKIKQFAQKNFKVDSDVSDYAEKVKNERKRLVMEF